MTNGPRNKVFGFFLTSLSGVFFTTASLFVRLCEDVPVSLIILVRFFLQTAIATCANYLIWKHPFYVRSKMFLLSTCGVLAFCVVYGLYFAFQAISLGVGEATVIVSITPLFVASLERAFLGVPLPGPTFVAGVLCTAGVALLAYPAFSDLHSGSGHLIGVAVAAIATVGNATNLIIIRRTEEHFIVVSFYLGLFMMLSAFVIPFQMVPETLGKIPCSQWIWIVLVSVFAVAGSLTLNAGLNFEQAVNVALVRNIDVVVAYIFDLTIFHQVFTAASLAGSGMVIAAILGNSVVSMILESRSREDETARLTSDLPN